MKGKSKEEILKILKFSATGVLNTAIDIILYTAILYFGGGIYLAQAVGYSIGTLNSYLINRRWTFKAADSDIGSTLFKFIVVNVITLLLSFVGIFVLELMFPPVILVFAINVSNLLIKTVIIFITMVVNFILSRFWVFND